MVNQSDARAVSALQAILSARLYLSEEMENLFVGPYNALSPTKKSLVSAMERTASWCIETERAQGWFSGELEEFGDTIAFDVLAHAQAASIELKPNELEAFYYVALAVIMDDFCVIMQMNGRTWCEDTPIQTLRNALLVSLQHDYSITLASPASEQATILRFARDLATQWHTWATPDDS